MISKKCSKCGKENDIEAKFCMSCGTVLVIEEQQTLGMELSSIVRDADELRKENKYLDALSLYEKAAELGDVHSQIWAGNFYDRGLGVEPDYAKALRWFEMAAKQNSDIALNNIGAMYENGKGVDKNVDKAIEYYLLSSGVGNSYASKNLASIYHFGNGVSQNYEVAVEYYNLALDQGSEDAVLHNNLGVLYMDGLGTPKDYDKAERLLTFAVQKGHEKAKENIQILLNSRADALRVEKRYLEAFSLYKKSAEQGDPHSQLWVGNFYDRGLGVEIDYAKALYWFEMAAKQNNNTAINNIGVMYENGKGVEKNIYKAIDYYLLASNAGNSYASVNLAQIYDLGKGVPQNYKLALKYYTLAIDQGSEDAVLYNNLGIIYMEGKGTPKDKDKGERLLNIAIEKGNEQAKKNLETYKKVTSPIGFFNAVKDGMKENSINIDNEIGKAVSNWAIDAFAEGVCLKWGSNTIDKNEKPAKIQIFVHQYGLQIINGFKNESKLINEKQIISLHQDESFFKKDKSIIGRGLVGGLLLGPAGAIVGGMSGFGTKEAKMYILTIKYAEKNNDLVKEIIIASEKNFEGFINGVHSTMQIGGIKIS